MSETMSFTRYGASSESTDLSDIQERSDQWLLANLERLTTDPVLTRALLEHLVGHRASSTSTAAPSPRYGSSATTALQMRIESLVATIDTALLSIPSVDVPSLFERSTPVIVPPEWLDELSRYSASVDPGFIMPDITSNDDDLD